MVQTHHGPPRHGEIPKWLKGLVLKTGSGVTPSWGSNPHFSAIEITGLMHLCQTFFFTDGFLSFPQINRGLDRVVKVVLFICRTGLFCVIL